MQSARSEDSAILMEWNLLNLIQKFGYFIALLEARADAIAWRIPLQVGALSDGELLRFSRSWASARRRSSSKAAVTRSGRPPPRWRA